jgi:hypothetical protein
MSRQSRVRKLIDLDIEKEISKRENGKTVEDLSAEYGLAKSTPLPGRFTPGKDPVHIV